MLLTIDLCTSNGFSPEILGSSIHKQKTTIIPKCKYEDRCIIFVNK